MITVSPLALLPPMPSGFEAAVQVSALWKRVFELIENAPHRQRVVLDLTGCKLDGVEEHWIGNALNRAASRALERCVGNGTLSLYLSDTKKFFHLPALGETNVCWSLGVLGLFQNGQPYKWIADVDLPLLTTDECMARSIGHILALIAKCDPLHLAAQLDSDLPAAFRKMRAIGEPLKKGTVGRHLADIKGAAGLVAEERTRRVGLWKRRISRQPWPPFEAAWHEMMEAEPVVPAMSPPVSPNIP